MSNTWNGTMMKFQSFLLWLSTATVLVSTNTGAESTQSSNLMYSSVGWNRNKSGLDSVLWNVAAVPSYALNWATHQGTTADLETEKFGDQVEHPGGPSGETVHSAVWAASDVVYGTSVTAEKQVEAFESNACAPNRMCLHYTQMGRFWSKKLQGLHEQKCDHSLSNDMKGKVKPGDRIRWCEIFYS